MKKVIVYTSYRCPFCKKVKDYLDSKNVPYEDYDVSKNRDKAEEMLKKTGKQLVPILDIEGEYIMGFDQEKIDEALDL